MNVIVAPLSLPSEVTIELRGGTVYRHINEAIDLTAHSRFSTAAAIAMAKATENCAVFSVGSFSARLCGESAAIFL